MSKFFTDHPIIGLVIVGLICATVVQTAEVIKGKENKLTLVNINKKDNAQEEVESVEE